MHCVWTETTAIIGVSCGTFLWEGGECKINVCKGHTRAPPRQCQGDQEELLRVAHASEAAHAGTHSPESHVLYFGNQRLFQSFHQ